MKCIFSQTDNGTVFYKNANNLYFFDSTNLNKSFVYFTSEEGFYIDNLTMLNAVGLKTQLGLITDYSIANQTNPKGYNASHSGLWNYAYAHEPTPARDIGIMGYTVFTKEPNAQLNFTYKNEIQITNGELVVLTQKSDFNLDLIVYINDKVFKTIESKDIKNVIKLIINDVSIKSISIKTKRTNNKQVNFTFFGLYLNPKDKEVVTIHNIPLKQSIFTFLQNTILWKEQLKFVNPCLTFLDFGTFPFLWGFNNQKIKELLPFTLKTIQKEISKKHGIICISSQELMRQTYPMLDAYYFNEAIHQSYINLNFGLIDWYSIAGGYKSSKIWKSDGLLTTNGFALNEKGLKIKEKMLGNCLFNLKKNLELGIINNTKPDFKINLDTDTLIAVVKDTLKNIFIAEPKELKKVISKEQPVINSNLFLIHKVKAGESLYGVAKKYKINSKEIIKINYLKNDKIVVNQKLKIPNNKLYITKDNENKKDVVTETNSNLKVKKDKPEKVTKVLEKVKSKTKYHLVKKGETLYFISKKYKVSLADIKKWNKLKTDNVNVGTKIIIEIN